MKKKNLLQEWKQTQEMYYEYFDRDELERDYMEWFGNSIKNYTYTDDQIIEELITDMLEYRKNDSIEQLKESIEHIKSLSRI
tara:strand:+ start:131 stop:376 length:246 start_codon:yes stop_codon:yes gene_type:complete